MRLPLLTLLLLALPPLVRADLRLSSPDFTSGASIPARFTCQGQNISPTLQIAGVPPDAQSLVLIVDDPDAPAGTFTHWLVWNIPPDTKILPGGARADSGIPGLAHHQGHPVMQGTNDFGRIGYSGPCLPSFRPKHPILPSHRGLAQGSGVRHPRPRHRQRGPHGPLRQNLLPMTSL